MGADNLQFAKPSHAKWNVLSKAEGVHHVYGPDGSLYGTYGTRCQAAAIAGIRQKEADQAERRMTRPCMCCRTPFESEGIHNRLCSRCRASGGEWNPYGIAPRSGRPR